MRAIKPKMMVLVAVSLITSLPLAAQAKPVERERYHETRSELIDDFCDIGGLTVLEQVDEYFNVTFNGHGKEGLAYFTGSFHGWASWTNVANGKTMTQVWNYVDKDQQVTDNGDGTLTILIKNAGSSKVYGPDGKLALSDPGQIQFEILVDNGGTPADPSDDEFLEFLGVVKGSTGRNDLQDRFFCDDIQTFIG